MNARHKDAADIEHDLVRSLKIELSLIPLLFRSECNRIDVATGKCQFKAHGDARCTFIHDPAERAFGQKLAHLRQTAMEKLCRMVGGAREYDLSSYYVVKLQLKYRKLITQYYTAVIERQNVSELSEVQIRRFLLSKQVELHLIPRIYNRQCFYANDVNPWCLRKAARFQCTFVHTERQKWFGDLLWKMKCDALEQQRNDPNEEKEKEKEEDVDMDLLDNGDEKSACTRSVVLDEDDVWWKKTIAPYKAANEEEHAADLEQTEAWRMDATQIRVYTQRVVASEPGALKHELFVEFEDEKSAKITPERTYVDFTFKCEWSVNFVAHHVDENLCKLLEECRLIRQFRGECARTATWVRAHSFRKHARKHLKTHSQILAVIVSFVVQPDKNYTGCVACFFRLCNGVKHTLLSSNKLVLRRTCGCVGERTHDFDTRECDILHGVLVEKLKSSHARNDKKKEKKGNDAANGGHGDGNSSLVCPRYKVLVNLRATALETYLMFLVIGYEQNSGMKTFADVLVSYPCNSTGYENINKKLNALYNKDDSTDEKKNDTTNGDERMHPITQVIFGYRQRKPQKHDAEPAVEREQISKLFRQLNTSQVDAAFGALNYNLHIIQGPPATGKTNTCAHVAYLWWYFNRERNIKIHGMAPTNQGTRLLAHKCHEMNEIMESQPKLLAIAVCTCDGYVRRFYDLNRVSAYAPIRELLLAYLDVNVSGRDHDESNANAREKRKFKVVYFASTTYTNILLIKNLLRAQDSDSESEHKSEQLCVNLSVESQLQQQCNYGDMTDEQKGRWKWKHMKARLKAADMICTTFGNSAHRMLVDNNFTDSFTHALCDESNQASLETFLGIIGYPNLTHLCMAGDIKQLAPVTMCQHPMATSSVYEQVISLVTDKTCVPNAYYTRLNKQYRSHPQIFNITTKIFYNDSVDINDEMRKDRAFNQARDKYAKLFAVPGNHIQFHILTASQKQMDVTANVTSKLNLEEVRVVTRYLKRFILELKGKEEEVAVISDYLAQKNCLYQHLTKVRGINEDRIMLCTTNEIEGSSKPIVIYMCCRSNYTGNIGFLNDPCRVNVATSRAEYGQIIIGDIFTLQYNPIFRKIFDIHQDKNAVVFEDKKKRLKSVDVRIPLLRVSEEHVVKKQKRCRALQQNGKFNAHKPSDFYECACCQSLLNAKTFCGRIVAAPPIRIYVCQKCISAYFKKWSALMKTSKYVGIKAITPVDIVQQSQLNATDSFGVDLEFDLLLGRYLTQYALTKFSANCGSAGGLSNLYRQFCKIVITMSDSCRYKLKHFPPCFQKLAAYVPSLVGLPNDEFVSKLRNDPERNSAIGIMECKRNQMLKQSIMDARFFRIVYFIKGAKRPLLTYYRKHRLDFYTFAEFAENQPTLIVVAYLKACGYSTNVANHLQRRVSKLLYHNNANKLSRNLQVSGLSQQQINDLVSSLKLNEFSGIRNVLQPQSESDTDGLDGHYVVDLMQRAVIDDEMSSFYERRKQEQALEKEWSFGEDLKNAGIEYYSERDLFAMGFRETPDYLLKKPWVVWCGNVRHEITWVDFKWFYCSATQWTIDKLRFQALRYNRTFGPGAFVFSLGFVKLPQPLQMQSYAMLAALPLSKDIVLNYIKHHNHG